MKNVRDVESRLPSAAPDSRARGRDQLGCRCDLVVGLDNPPILAAGRYPTRPGSDRIDRTSSAYFSSESSSGS